MKSLAGKVAALTGAASGIGRELAVTLADEGCNLALADVDERGIAKTISMIRNGSVNVTSRYCNVADRDNVYAFAEHVQKAHGHVDVVINNAAVMVADSLEEVSYEDFEWLMGINFWGVVYGTKAFLPYLRLRPQAHVVNMSSINGVVTTPNNGPYCIAKFAVVGFSETLLQELHGSNVRVSYVLPGSVKTNIIRNTRFRKQANPELGREGSVEWFERAAKTTPEQAARIIVAGIKKNKSRILVGPDAYLIDVMKRLMPALASRYAGYAIRHLNTKKSGWLR
ncbi:MAG: SDR family NAD(P)-dependent oxidoreductase [Pseudomonadota bacterium]